MADTLDRDLSDADLLAELGVSAPARPAAARTPLEERVLAGFEDITRFAAEHGRAPRHGEERDIFERLYAVRLDRLREDTRFHDLLAPLDTAGLLRGESSGPAVPDDLDDAALLAELGVEPTAPDSVTNLRHVRSRDEVRAAEEIATRERCADFETFAPLFAAVKRDLDAGARRTRRFERMAEIRRGEFFIVCGQIAYVAEVGEEFFSEYDRRDSRLRVIYDNGTESDILLRSLQRALHKDEAGRRVTTPSAGPLFDDAMDEGDARSGTIYVLSSLSDHPRIAASRNAIHKIGVTGGSVEARIAGAKDDPTYLLAPVKVEATYELSGVSRSKLENLLHRVFEDARLDLTIPDRFGRPFRPREWFLVPLPAIDEAVRRLKDGTLAGVRYDPATAGFVPVGR